MPSVLETGMACWSGVGLGHLVRSSGKEWQNSCVSHSIQLGHMLHLPLLFKPLTSMLSDGEPSRNLDAQQPLCVTSSLHMYAQCMYADGSLALPSIFPLANPH